MAGFAAMDLGNGVKCTARARALADHALQQVGADHHLLVSQFKVHPSSHIIDSKTGRTLAYHGSVSVLMRVIFIAETCQPMSVRT